MTDQQLQAFAKEVHKLCAAFRRPCTNATIEAFWDALRDLPLDATRGAFEASIRDLSQCPAPAAVRALALSISSANTRKNSNKMAEEPSLEKDPIGARLKAELDRAKMAWSSHRDDHRAMSDVTEAMCDAGAKWGQEVRAGYLDPLPHTGLHGVLPRVARTAARGILASWKAQNSISR